MLRMNYRVETLKNSPMIYRRTIGPYGSADHFKMMQTFKEWIAKNNLQKEVTMNGILGIALDDPSNIPSEKCRYDLILCVPNHRKYHSEGTIGQFKGGKYAVFTVPHTKEAVQEFWANLENIRRQIKLKLRESPIIERFKEEAGLCEFLVPIN